MARELQVEGQQFQPVINRIAPLDLHDVLPPSTQAHKAISMKTFQFTKSIFSGKRQNGKDVHVMRAVSPQSKTADAKTRLVAAHGAQPADPSNINSNEGSLLNNASSLLKQHQESRPNSARNSDLCTPELLGSKSPRAARDQMPKIIEKNRLSSRYEHEQDQAELDCHGVTEMVELD